MLNPSDKSNYETLIKAAEAGNVALMDVRRRSDGKSVAAVCAVGFDGDNQYTFTPFAIMVEGNPFDLFDPPAEGAEGYHKA